jgi:transcriptional regulator with XRE-family HTH domain
MNEEDTIEAAPRDPLIEAIRERVLAYIGGATGYEGMSLRELARRIGMSPSGVMKFADGSMPYTGTRRKLIRWYRTLSAATREEQLRDAFAMLLVDVHPSQRPAAELRIREILAAYGPPGAGPVIRPPRGRRPGRTGGGAAG